ncbi:MAG TPA: FG-GAP-like repeat-containing protein [Solirubrobacteraceae bacterium]|jgi:hypothetical protein
MASESAVDPAGLSLGIRGRRYPVLLPSVRDPRLRLSAVIVSLQILGQTSLGFQVSIAQILITLATAAAIEMTIVFWQRGVIMWPASALVTGNGIAFILRVPGTAHGDWWSLRGAWIFVATAAIGVLSKHVIRVRGRHIFNPSNLGLVVIFLALGSTRTEPQYFWWGPLNTWLVLTIAVITLGALVVLSRLGQLRVALGFWLAFAAGIGVLAISGHEMTARWHVGPVTGLSFWTVLVTSPEVFVFMSFMITDPKTNPRGSAGRWCYAVAIGLLAALLIAPQRTEFASKVAVLAALAIVCACWPLLGWLSSTERICVWRARIDARAPWRAGRSRSGRLASTGALALCAGAAYAAILVGAGIPARPPSATPLRGSLLSVSTQVSAAELPAVTVAPTSNVVSISHATALQIARDLVVDLRLQAGALQRHSRRLAATAATGASLRQLERQIKASASGNEVRTHSYRLRRLTLSLVPGPDQAAPFVLASFSGTAAWATYSGTPAHLITSGPSSAIAEQVRLKLVNGRYEIVSAKAAKAGAASPAPAAPSPVEVALAPAGSSTVALGEAFSVHIAVTLRKGQRYEKPVTVALSIEGPGAPAVRFLHAGLIVAPGTPVTHVASVTPSEWYAHPGAYRIVASVGGRAVGAPLPFTVRAPTVTIPHFEDVTKASGLASTVPAPTCGEFITTPAWGQAGPAGGLALFVPRLSAPSQLFVQRSPGHFVDVAAASGVDVRHATAASFGDYLNNGRQDLFVARYGAPSLLFRNDGDGHFTNVTASSGIAGVAHASSVTWVDYNNDGRVDLYVTNYMTCQGRWTSGTDSLSRVRYYGARLFRNDGGGRFTDVSKALPENPKGAGLTAGWFEATNDGRDDLYLGNDNVGQDPDHNRLYINSGHAAGSAFSETSISSGTALYMNTMGIAVGDFTRNGRLDVALSNIGGNQLLMNQGNGTFKPAAASMGVMRADQFGSYPSVTWGVGAYDFTDDGWQDLYFTAGNVNPKLTRFEGTQPSELFLNNGGKGFLDVSAPSGAASAGDAKGAAFADYLRNGRVDMYVLAQDGSPHLFRNVTTLEGNRWLEVRAIGTVSNRDGCGARVLASAGGVTQMREILCAQNEQTAQFGLAHAATVSKLEIIWPSGIRQVIRNVGADRYLTVTEPRACAKARFRSARC